jgi:hypothetical protein
MSAIVLKDIPFEIDLQVDDPEERFITTGVGWQQYENLLEKLGDTPWYRVTYLEGVLEIRSPSRRRPKQNQYWHAFRSLFSGNADSFLGTRFNDLPEPG